MAGQALYLKYRPRVFDDMIGQEHITRTIRNALAQNRLRHAYLFSGTRGTGKTTTARLLAKAVNCTYPDAQYRPCDQCEACIAVNEGRYLDLIEIDAASNNGVDDVRELREKIGFAPNEGRYKVYVIDEVHRFSAAAFDALLKTLEEPPSHAIFILATTELDKVPVTIKSRCLKFEFRRVSMTEVADRLQMIAELEGISVERAALELVARQGTGSVRDSISLLDQLVADPTVTITLADAQAVLGTANHQAVSLLVDALVAGDAARGLEILNQAIDEGIDVRQFGGQIVEHLRNVMLAQTGGPALIEGSDEQRAQFAAQGAAVSRAALVRMVRLFNTAVSEMRTSWQLQLPLELAIVDSTRPAVEETVPAVAARPAPVKSKLKQAEPEPEPEEEVPEGSASLNEIRHNWAEIVNLINSHDATKPVAAKLRFAEPKGVEGSMLIVAVNNPALVNNLNDEKSKKTLQRAIARIMNVTLNIKIVPGAGIKGAPTAEADLPDDLADFKRETGAVVRTDSQK